jgi:arylformamidase
METAAASPAAAVFYGHRKIAVIQPCIAFQYHGTDESPSERTNGMARLLSLLLVCAAFTAAAQPARRIERDIPYAQPKNERHLLDVFAPASGANFPVVVWVHGGGWMRGSKSEVDHKPQAFNDKGFVFVPVNYRFVPQVTMYTIVRDVAKSVGWVHANIARYGGDPKKIFLMGHSAGGQLVALLCTDSRYIEAEGVPRSSIAGCVPVDGDTYDVPLQVATFTARRKSLKQPAPKLGHPEKFGTLDEQRELSAVNHVAPNRGIPPFLLLHVADHTDTSAQAYRLWAALDIARVPATIFGAESSDHVKLDRDLGLPGDPSTKALFDFTSRVLGAR